MIKDIIELLKCAQGVLFTKSYAKVLRLALIEAAKKDGFILQNIPLSTFEKASTILLHEIAEGNVSDVYYYLHMREESNIKA